MEQIVRDALDKSVSLLKAWQKKSAFGGNGWHELTTSDHAGAHASCAALKLVAHPLFPIPDNEREKLVEDVVLRHLKPLYEGNGNQAEEAKHSTVKVANLLSGCAAIGRNARLTSTFQQIVPLGRKLADDLAKGGHGSQWGHWLAQPAAEPRHLPTATAVDAIYRFGQVDTHVQQKHSALLSNFGQTAFDEFLNLTRRPAKSLEVWELWHRLPLLRTLAIVPSPVANLPEAYREIFNAYVSRDVFGWGLTSTEDFQKFNSNGKADGTDYVSFNTTACLVRAVTAAVQTGKLDLAFFDWATPFLADWAFRIIKDELPMPKRFSFIHQALSCLQAALELHLVRKALATTMPMHINPAVFQDRGFQLKPNQGFFVTPFDLSPFSLNRLQVQSYVVSACSTFQGGAKNLKLIPGDHNFTGPGIMSRIWQHINESAFVIAVCLGANSNVYYEVGVAHTLGKPVLLLGRAGHEKDDIKFDLQGVRYEVLNNFNDVAEMEGKVHKFLGEALRL